MQDVITPKENTKWKSHISFWTQDNLSLLLSFVFCWCLCFYLGISLCYGIPKGDSKDYTKFNQGVNSRFLKLWYLGLFKNYLGLT